MIRADARIDRADTPEQRARNAQRKLAKAEAKIRTLQSNVDDQQQQIRALLARIDDMERCVAERAELEAEVHALRGEARELTRANREQVKRNEALQAEIAKLKAEGKARKLAA